MHAHTCIILENSNNVYVGITTVAWATASFLRSVKRTITKRPNDPNEG